MKRGIFVLVSLILLVGLVDATDTRVRDAEINGSVSGLLGGYSLASGDFNNDSVDDLIVGKYSDSGYVYLFFGDPVTGIVNQTTGDANVTFSNAGGLNSKFGRCVMMLDFNNDSIDDVVIASSQSDVDNSGTVDGLLNVYYGNSDIVNGRSFGSTSWNVSIEGVQHASNLNYLCNDNNEMDFGDLNNDSINDIVVSNYNADLDGIFSTNEGQVYVFFGFDDPARTDYTLNVTFGANITINGSSFISSNPERLSAIDVIPDTNGDGIDDLLIGGDGTYSAYASSGGAAYIFFGEQDSVGFNYQANNSANVTFNGDLIYEIGVQVAGGDFNNDGLSDIAIGSLNGSAWAGGQVGLFYSSPNWLEIPGPLSGISYNFSDANLTINGSYTLVTTVDPKRGGIEVTLQNRENLGSDRMKIIDINNDSIKDLVVSSLDARPYDDYALTYDLPSIYSVYGNTDNSTFSFLSNETNLTLSGRFEYGNNGADNFGIDFVDIDTNNDTTKELAIGVYYALVYDYNSGIDILGGKTYIYNWEDDSVAPSISVPSSFLYYNTSSSTLDFNATISDDANRAKDIFYELYEYSNWAYNGIENFTATLGSEFGVWNTTFNFSLNGRYKILVWAEDEVDNLNNTELIYFRYDTVVPNVTNISANEYYGQIGDSFQLNYSGFDNDTMIDSVYFILQSTDEDNNLTISSSQNSITQEIFDPFPNEYWNATWDSVGYSTGTYFFDVLINDTAGNSIEKENYFSIILVGSNVIVESYTNNSLDITANTTQTIDDSANTGLTLDLVTTDTITDSSVSMTSYTSNVENSTSGFGALELGKYFSIVVSSEINGNLSGDTVIRLYYSDAEITAAGIDETTLRLYRFNDSTSQWDILDPSGVDTVNNYIWGNVTSFSSFGAAGSAASVATSTTTTSTVTGGGGSSAVTLVKSGEIVNINILKDFVTEAKMDKGSIVQFMFNNELHSIDIKDVDSESNIVTFEVKSIPQILKIQIGKRQSVDLDNDNVMDIEIHVKNIIGTKAYLEFKGLSDRFIGQEMIFEESVDSNLQQDYESLNSKNSFWLIVGVIFVMILISIAIYISYKRNKRQQLGYW